MNIADRRPEGVEQGYGEERKKGTAQMDGWRVLGQCEQV